MKRIICLASLLLGLSVPSWSYFETYRFNSSSFTKTADTTQNIANTIPGTVLEGVIITSSNTAGTSLTLYDSSATANNTIAVIDLFNTTGMNEYIPFEVKLSSGLTYTCSASRGITIIYRKFKE